MRQLQSRLRQDFFTRLSDLGIFFLFLTGIFFLNISPARAELATPDEMEQVCRNWLTTVVYAQGQWAGSLDPKIVSVEDIVVDDTLLARYYAIDPAGYIIIPALKEMAPVKAYSEQYSLDIKEKDGFALLIRQVLHSQMRTFAEVYGSLDAAQSGATILFDASNRELWNTLTIPAGEFAPYRDKAISEPMLEAGPLLTTAWHQGAPYNNLCPDGDGDRCVVGCVATAAAQIVRYHQWPPYGTGSHAYYWGGDNSCDGSTPGQNLSADYSDAYSYDDSPAAVAELSYEMGIAFDMDYGACGSGAYTSDGTWVFSTYFNYAEGSIWRWRENFTPESWFNLIKAEINQGRPILYRIYLHAIVCDGWRQLGSLDQYHFNYGWGGSQNAWYTVDNLYCNWDGCDTMEEGMVSNIVPKTSIIWLGGTAITDQVSGDHDNIPEAGETVELTVTLANFGAQSVSDVSAQLLVDDASITVVDGATTYGAIGARDSVKNTVDPFVVTIPPGYASRIDSFFVVISYNAGATIDTLVFEKALGRTNVLLIDDDEYTAIDTYYKGCFDRLRVPYDIWIHAPYQAPDSAYLAGYGIVVWYTGDYRTGLLNSTEIARIKGYLNGGGKLLLSGQGIAAQLNSANPAFLHDYLKADYLSTSNVPILTAAPSAQVFIPRDTLIIQGYGGASNQTMQDHVAPINGGVGELYYYAQSNYGTISYSGTYQLVFFGFGFEAIINGDLRRTERDTALARVLDYFGYAQPNGCPRLLSLTPAPGTPMNLITHSPDLHWSYYDPQALPQQQYQLQVGSDSNWTVAEMWEVGPVSAPDTTIAYGGEMMVDGAKYYMRVRIFDGILWSDWFQSQMRPNSRPTTPTGHTPATMAGVTSATPYLTVTNATDNENDVLTYAFELYDDSLMTNLIASVDHIAQGSSSTTRWQVTPALNDDQDYFWRVKADDGFEPGDWSPLAAFWVNSANQAPSAFGLISPMDESRIGELRPSFVWNAAHDADPYDAITYILYYSKDSIFYQFKTVNGLQDTTCTLTQSLLYGTRYFWRVKATDAFNATVYSSDTYAFNTGIIGDANGDATINVGDAVHIINYVFKGGAAPEPLVTGDANCDATIDVGDAVFLINYLFKGGSTPTCTG